MCTVYLVLEEAEFEALKDLQTAAVDLSKREDDFVSDDACNIAFALADLNFCRPIT